MGDQGQRFTPADPEGDGSGAEAVAEEGARSTVGGSAVPQANAGLFSDTAPAPTKSRASPGARWAELLCGRR